MTTIATLPQTKKEFRDWLRAAGFPKRFCERMAAHFPGVEEESEREPESGDADASELLKSIQELTERMGEKP